MAFHPFDVSVAHITYAALGGFVVLFGMFSLFIREKLYIGEAIWAFLFGVVIGPYGGNIFNPRGWANGHEATGDNITLEVTRVVLAIGVFAIGVELPKQYMKRHWKSLFFLLGPVMTWGWFVSAGLIFALVPEASFLSSLVIAACLTPTDPILAAAVVGGKYADKHVPTHLRHLLAAESGCNDGAAFPFLFIALYIILDSTKGHAVEDWFLITWLYEVVLGISIGVALGIGFRHLMKFCERKDLIDRKSYVAQYVSLALFSIGVTTLLGSDDLLAAFASGTAFAWDGFFNKQTEQAVFSSVIDLLFNIAAFVYIGAWMPFNDFHSDELTLTVWRLLVIGILILLLRRLPVVIALYRWIPDIKTFREAVFSSHFGPMGVGAVFISTLAKAKLPPAQSPPRDQVEFLSASIQPIVSFMVLCSIVTHGLSIPFFSLGRRVHSVSRTWSRHQSMDPVPEWMAHTRQINRGENIVINRDDDAIERGEAPGSVSEAVLAACDNEKSSSGSNEKSQYDAMGEEANVAHEAEGSAASSAQEAENGTAEVGQKTWPEGRDLVIERQISGDEVDVKVIPDAVSTPTDQHVRTLASKLLSTLRQATPSEAQVPEAPLASRSSPNILASQSLDAPQSPMASEDEWQDIDETSKEEHSQRLSTSRQKNISIASTKGVQKIPKRRRNSFRHGIFSKNIRYPRTSESSNPVSEDGRGRATAPKLVQTRSDPLVGRLNTSSELPARERSPTRSIRWDNVPEGHDHAAPTPRFGRSPLHSRAPSPEREAPKVQFEIPSATPTRP